MNRKGFTLIELIMVIIILGIISIIAIPGILDALKESQSDSGEKLQEILESDLALYNKDNEEDLWCDKEDFLSGTDDVTDEAVIETEICRDQFEKDYTIGVSINDLYSSNSNINLGECLFNENIDVDNDGNKYALAITRKKNGEFVYKVHIMCSKEFVGTNVKTVKDFDSVPENVYYVSEENSD